MDPNEALKDIRRALWEYENEEDNVIDVADTIAQAFGALDGWLSNGGFLPEDWHR